MIISCTGNDAQEEFERSAYSPANGITITDNSSNIIGDPDEDDWRVSPFYSGLATIEPAFPNPILYGTAATLEVNMTGNSFTSVLELGYFDFQDRWTQIDLKDNIEEFGFTSFRIDAGQLFGENAEVSRGLYRLVLFDGNQRVVTYGDIEIE